MFAPLTLLSQVARMPEKFLGPSVAKVSFPGFALSYATSSERLLAGTLALARIRKGFFATMETATKSLTGS